MEWSDIKDGILSALKERYVSNKLAYSTLITTCVLNGKGILYFIFSDTNGKLAIIKNFDYGKSFFLNDVCLAFVISVAFLAILPIITGILNKLLLNYSEAFLRWVDREFKEQQAKKDGEVAKVQMQNSHECKFKEVELDLEKARSDYENACQEHSALKSRVISLNKKISILESTILNLETENRHNRNVCELSKRSAQHFIDSTRENIRVLQMYSDMKEYSITEFSHKLTEAQNKMAVLSEELRVDRTFEPKTIEFLIGINPQKREEA
ncbi:hypothetical protein OB947_06165 [Aeromonas bestiarum]|uniref:hypothetical protein n=1 Tax=Aeromonas TaxID=642 RepID=UPI00259F9C23|nr:hypothetical protein [Aeromonas bestiarum]MDM5088505.1 hypothetical protein [Aeromonas bestiarum]